MAFLDKIGQVANKVGEVAGDTFDYSKAKGKVVLEKGKIKDIKEALGDYVYDAVSTDGGVDMDRVKAFCAEIDEHIANIEELQAEAKESGENIAETFGGKDGE
ncbi:MAG: hypothetical protein UIJ88_00385 [Anaerovoracaceae bacterium]|nr:hypothetical protein [Anaerovoracaceae bacterium]